MSPNNSNPQSNDNGDVDDLAVIYDAADLTFTTDGVFTVQASPVFGEAYYPDPTDPAFRDPIGDARRINMGVPDGIEIQRGDGTPNIGDGVDPGVRA